MKKVFRIKYRYYWACNGQLIRNMYYTERIGSKLWMTRFKHPRIQIEMVKPPAGRCPHCGEKLCPPKKKNVTS